MEQFSFVFTIFFMLLGPIKLLPAFNGVTKGAGGKLRRALAVRATLIASATVTLVALTGTALLERYRISIDGVRIAGGLVLLLAALNTIFAKTQPQPHVAGNATALQLAFSPMVIPVIIPPAGVAAILIFMMLSPEYPGMKPAVAIALAVVMALDFLVMYYSHEITKNVWVTLMSHVFGGVLIFMQVALAVETVLTALRYLGLIHGQGGR